MVREINDWKTLLNSFIKISLKQKNRVEYIYSFSPKTNHIILYSSKLYSQLPLWFPLEIHTSYFPQWQITKTIKPNKSSYNGFKWCSRGHCKWPKEGISNSSANANYTHCRVLAKQETNDCSITSERRRSVTHT